MQISVKHGRGPCTQHVAICGSTPKSTPAGSFSTSGSDLQRVDDGAVQFSPLRMSIDALHQVVVDSLRRC